MQCKGLTITVTDSTTNQFITPKEIRSYLDKEYKGYVGKQLDNIDLSTVEKILESKSAILKSQITVEVLIYTPILFGSNTNELAVSDRDIAVGIMVLGIACNSVTLAVALERNVLDRSVAGAVEDVILRRA